MYEIPSISNYGSGQANTIKLSFTNLSLWYSYKTLVAFETEESGLVVSENIWTVTTGKHLNWIDGGDKKSRLPYNQFQAKLRESLDKLRL